MSIRRELRFLLVATCLVFAPGALALAFAQTPPPRAAAIEQQLRDVREHRDWLESQLATAKAMNAALAEQLRAALARPCEEPAK